MSKFETLILRFRDLSDVNTIEEHKKIIADKGSVYWGWWSKPQEQVPLIEIRDFKKQISDSAKRIFLFDSGRKLIYEANCREIYTSEGDPCSIEDNSLIPEYYRLVQYKMWFKFDKISACNKETTEKLLQQYAYVCIDDFFVGRKAPSRVFENKIVYGTQELYEQQITIWFLRKANATDSKHEIHSYQHDYLTDEKNNKTFRVLTTNKMLWLSDLHFSSEHHAFKGIPGSTTTLNSCLHQELRAIKADNEISYMIISGDITFKCVKEEYDMALEFFKNLNSTLVLIAVCIPLFQVTMTSASLKSQKVMTNTKQFLLLMTPQKMNIRNFMKNLPVILRKSIFLQSTES